MDIKSILSISKELIKAKQTFLLLYTGVFAYLITLVEFSIIIDGFDFLFLVLSLFLSISGTTSLNMYIDKDIDAIMERTKDRPIPSGRVSPTLALIYGFLLVCSGILIAFFILDWLTGLVIFLGFFFDVIIYSLISKRRTKYSIIFGGVAGGLPALAGRTVLLKAIDSLGILFLGFILTWIPVHILTIALIPKNYEGYKKAQIPMWPVVTSEKKTMRIIAIGAFLSSLALYECAQLLNANGVIRIIIAICCGVLIYFVIRDLIKPSNKLTFLIFKIASLYMIIGFLLLYLGVVF